MTYRATAGISVIFGAIHCIGWGFSFPTIVEQFMWRTCSATITGLPLVMIFTWRVHDSITPPKKSGDKDKVNVTSPDAEKQQKQTQKAGRASLSALVSNATDHIVVVLVPLLYITARIMLLVLALTSLRALPSGVYRTISWTEYIPHI